MNIFQASILGTVEGLSEFLPISSTGHLILASKILGVQSNEFVKSFEIFIQSGSILAVLVLYVHELFTKKDLFIKVITAFIPTAAIGLILYKLIKGYLLGNVQVTLWALIIGGVILFAVETVFKRKKVDERSVTSITYKNAFLVGLIQSISIIPGVSRSASTIIGGMVLGMDRKTAVEFSFLLAIPTLLAATGLDLVKSSFNFTTSEWILLLTGFISSFIVAIVVIKWFIAYVRNHTFIPFGVYRVVVAILFFLLFLR